MKDIEKEVILYFKTNVENAVPKIAKALELPQWKEKKIIDKYLITKQLQRLNQPKNLIT